MVDVTRNYGFIKPFFDEEIWHDDVNGNFDQIDALFFAVTGLGNFVGTWTNSTNYTVGQRVFDPDDGTIWNCLVDHTSPPTGTFEADRTANPANWNSVSTLPFVRGEWTPDTVYSSGDVAYDNGESLFGIASVTHTSSSLPATMRTDIANWSIIADLSALAIAVTSVNGESGVVTLTSDDISDAAQTRKYVTAAEKAQITTNQNNISSILSTIGAYTTVVSRSVDSLLPPTGMIMAWTSTTAPTQVNGNGSTPSWLLCKGQTIGDAASGATLRANADMSNLFTHLWTNFGNTELIIQDSSGGATVRGGSAAADFAAHKRMPVPNIQGEKMVFADNGRGKVTVTGHSTTGAEIGTQSSVIAQANLPSVNLSSAGLSVGTSITNGTSVNRNSSSSKRNDIAATGGQDAVEDTNFTEATLSLANGSVSGNIPLGGSGTALAILDPAIVLPAAVIKT